MSQILAKIIIDKLKWPIMGTNGLPCQAPWHRLNSNYHPKWAARMKNKGQKQSQTNFMPSQIAGTDSTISSEHNFCISRLFICGGP